MTCSSNSYDLLQRAFLDAFCSDSFRRQSAYDWVMQEEFDHACKQAGFDSEELRERFLLAYDLEDSTLILTEEGALR